MHGPRDSEEGLHDPVTAMTFSADKPPCLRELEKRKFQVRTSVEP